MPNLREDSVSGLFVLDLVWLFILVLFSAFASFLPTLPYLRGRYFLYSC